MTDSDFFSTEKISREKSFAQKILSVSELNHMVGEVLTQTFPLMWISGEVSNFTRAASGHWYFSLKDEKAQVRCVMFKGRNNYVDFDLREGDHVEARCNISFYEPRGDFQLNIEFIRKAGLGALFEAFEKLKLKLTAEGLFEASRKKPLPAFPKAIGIVTSLDAAALRDVLTTLKRRNPSIAIILYPTPVQGKGAAEHIAKAIRTASTHAEVDTLIICRGGGSMEDLWQFNEEVVARAIAECHIPTISGVGHETDFTICDFVADLRAATPTAAAELACADLATVKTRLLQLHNSLYQRIRIRLNQHAQTLDFFARRLISPLQQLENKSVQISQLQHRLNLAMNQNMTKQQHRLQRIKTSLAQLNPHAVLGRGYAIVLNQENKLVTDVTQVVESEAINVLVSHGTIQAQVIRLKKDSG